MSSSYSIHSEQSLPAAPEGDEYYVYPYDDAGDANRDDPSDRFNYFCNARDIGTRVFSFLPNFFHVAALV